ncbi:two-component system, sensor histidine kinase YesM [Paenibacillus uliginis N3/975]|uniref:Two-component system, sensor histidine kinase YesM n=1 Tax=Paenibacillus uliginis N3/975 TaxID=1313296 RepID=A0A1X7HL84_9BACL|nr:histidine kinase [Paenibacillus uliginis]SMF87850.1 two-component system, sensor histidine kinase YesM [Paenibacillus uliginis N3/975]
MRFRYRLLASYLVLIALPLLVLSIVYYVTSLRMVTEQAQQNVYEIVKKSNEVMDTKLRKVEQGTLALFVDKELYKIFNGLDSSNKAELLDADRQISSILSKYFTQNEDVYAYQLWTSYYTFGTQRALPQGDPTRSHIYQTAENAEGKMIWYPTYDFIQMFGQQWLSDSDIEYRYMFSATRLLNFSHLENSSIVKLKSGVERPILNISFKADVFQSLFNNSIPSGSDYLVIDPENHVVASSNADQITKIYGETWLDDFRQIGSGTRKVELGNERMIVCFDRSSVTGWLSVVMTPESALVGRLVSTAQISTLVLSALLGLIAVIFAYFIIGRITGPIRKLLITMKSVGEGDFGARVAVETKDEFGFLLLRFNRMNDRIQMLIQENYEIQLKEKQAEIQALNMQMNPHFLYNTLNIMNWMAIETGQRELSKMLVGLSNMLHYTSRKDWNAVNLSEEIEWMNHYFFIMSTRFENKFSVEYKIDPMLYEMKVPRLLFQPFVENAILHGLDQLETGGLITVSGRNEDGYRIFEVADNGRGMSEDTVQKILDKRSTSVGIINTISRIQMAYGKEYGVDISSLPGKGTTVIIKLPPIPQK